ncbi:MAG: RnfH family protein [Gammaproteobacteria bacterium 28-57-27]|nr:MAG: RnfH family protein [Gammaproteobacteria bacterium 28-57-27]
MAVESELIATKLIDVEVAYALPERQTLLRLNVPVGTTAEQAVRRSGLLERYPELDLGGSKLGIFAKVVPPQRELREGDRVEIYRPLIADPKAVRQKRAEEGKKLKKGGG